MSLKTLGICINRYSSQIWNTEEIIDEKKNQHGCQIKIFESMALHLQKEVCLLCKKLLSDHMCERKNMVGKYKIFLNVT